MKTTGPCCTVPSCTLKIEQPFIRHIPIAIVMSISHMGCRATMYRPGDSKDATFDFGLRPALVRYGARNGRP